MCVCFLLVYIQLDNTFVFPSDEYNKVSDFLKLISQVIKI